MAIEVTGKFKPKSGKTFPIIDAVDVEMPDGTRLSSLKGGVASVNGVTPDKNGNALVEAKHITYKDGKLPDYMPVAVTQEEYDKMVADGTINERTPYLIVEGESK